MLNRGKATWCYAEQIVLRCWTSFSSYSRQISRVTHFPWELFHIKVTLSEPPESKSMQINDREKCTYSQIHPCGQLLAAGVCRRLVEASCRCPSPGIRVNIYLAAHNTIFSSSSTLHIACGGWVPVTVFSLEANSPFWLDDSQWGANFSALRFNHSKNVFL